MKEQWNILYGEKKTSKTVTDDTDLNVSSTGLPSLMTNDLLRMFFLQKYLIPDQSFSTAEISIMSVSIVSNVNANLSLLHLLLWPVLADYHARAATFHISLLEVNEAQVMLCYVGRVFTK